MAYPAKRVLDFMFSFFSLLLTLPLISFVIIVILLFFQENPFFFQKRIGYRGELFTLIKFKTLYRRNHFWPLFNYNNLPLNHFGFFLRRSRIDELLQFINILIGHMSVIGPRPCLPELINEFDENGYARLKVKPGLFGLADINGGNFIPWKTRWVYDRIYSEKISLYTDYLIFRKVFYILLFDEDFFLKRDKLLIL